MGIPLGTELSECPSDGSFDGSNDGLSDDFSDETSDRASVGTADCEDLASASPIAAIVPAAVGSRLRVGSVLGIKDGSSLGRKVAIWLGSDDGNNEGMKLGCSLGSNEGAVLGESDGNDEGSTLGVTLEDGTSLFDGAGVGSGVSTKDAFSFPWSLQSMEAISPQMVLSIQST